jgi:hypothetical protein
MEKRRKIFRRCEQKADLYTSNRGRKRKKTQEIMRNQKQRKEELEKEIEKIKRGEEF